MREDSQFNVSHPFVLQFLEYKRDVWQNSTQNADDNLSENSEKVVSSESRVTDLWEVCVADGNALSGSRLPVDHVADVRLHLNEWMNECIDRRINQQDEQEHEY